jgi:hypothetical protein
VLVWLGLPAKGSDTLFQFLNKLMISISHESAALSVSQMSKEDWKLSQETVMFAGIDIWRACEAFAQRSYWSRTWILQELLLARWPVLICGDFKTSWQSWTVLLDNLSRLETMTVSWTPKLFKSSAYFICQQWFNEMNGEQPSGIIQLVHRFRQSSCSDVHDKIYALLGMASDASGIQVDYNCSKEELLVDLLLPGNPFYPVDFLYEILYTLDPDLWALKTTYERLLFDDKSKKAAVHAIGHFDAKSRGLLLQWKSLSPQSNLEWLYLKNKARYPQAYTQAYLKERSTHLQCSCHSCKHKGLGREILANEVEASTKLIEPLVVIGMSSPKDGEFIFRRNRKRLVYIATHVYNIASQQHLNYYDPVHLKWDGQKPLVRVSIEQAFNLAFHRGLPISERKAEDAPATPT